jgi:alkylation response protein AidB-like acyl-CoA dehydrogenase
VPIENLIGLLPRQRAQAGQPGFRLHPPDGGLHGAGRRRGRHGNRYPYAKERIQFGTTLSEKQGYTHKLIVPNVVRLAAADAYIDEVAHMLDSSDEDLQVEGAIGKYFATEAADRAANDLHPGLGRLRLYPRIRSKRSSATSRSPASTKAPAKSSRSIISTFRWKASRKSKGRFYGSMAEELEALASRSRTPAARFYALAAGALNQTIDLAHNNRLTRQQAVMFALADMMTHVEVGAAWRARPAA